MGGGRGARAVGRDSTLGNGRRGWLTKLQHSCGALSASRTALSLSHDSRGGNGLLGYRWDMPAEMIGTSWDTMADDNKYFFF